MVMRQKCVDEILLPLKTGTPDHPAVAINDKITRAIELMVTHNISYIIVTRNNRPIGMVRLDDAFKMIGL